MKICRDCKSTPVDRGNGIGCMTCAPLVKSYRRQNMKRPINGSTRKQRMSRMKVWVPCVGEYRLITETQKEFLDVSEGPQGQDMLKYVCSWCGKIHEGQVTGS